MVTTEIITLSLIIGFLLIIAGAYLKGRALYLALFGSILFVITGIVLLSSPLEFPTGTTTIIAGSIYTTTITYTSQNVGINTVLSFIILFIGLMGTYLGATALYEPKYDDDEER